MPSPEQFAQYVGQVLTSTCLSVPALDACSLSHRLARSLCATQTGLAARPTSRRGSVWSNLFRLQSFRVREQVATTVPEAQVHCAAPK